jgi:preprotein translocase subunit SecG
MQTVVIVIHLMLVVALIGAVLLQRSEGGGFASGSNSGFLSSRGTANILTRTTAFLAMGFFITSLILSAMASWGRKPISILGTEAPPGQQSPVGTPPIGQGSGGLLDTLRGPPSQQPPSQPPSPTGPQAPQSR